MPYPIDNKVVPPVWVESGGKFKKLYQDAEVQISLLTGQLQQAQADLATAQSQIQQDAQTIATLQVQVTALQAQIAALSDPAYQRYVVARITKTGGGVYIPPSYADPTVNLSSLLGRAVSSQITRTGGGYP
jgi:hypothetical protein